MVDTRGLLCMKVKGRAVDTLALPAIKDKLSVAQTDSDSGVTMVASGAEEPLWLISRHNMVDV